MLDRIHIKKENKKGKKKKNIEREREREKKNIEREREREKKNIERETSFQHDW